ncbi:MULTISPECIES: hypothetical protein [unclassified Paenibacillus]|uniref:hypothetical protein n=1 Tax=unclassified Paenibacillus TaxID=185978 RepID=UPI001AE4149B|nr:MULTISPECIES: hypothetical protein [unclassified Paenibacillus]MBP1154322.1 hypothetical protein [Paenibacillus sp. PvP091]MBP1170294.1 hypothetical protein [Paenibacillus sp. PvR098]MBP2441322.1 hypothetical protein [Paenibacillus sp. PvP052]
MVKILFNDLQIQSVSQSSGVFSGHNIISDWKHYSKSNEGFGSMKGKENVSEHGHHLVIDNDLMELIYKKDGKRWGS